MKEILQSIIKNPKTEARWLNTISLLEHIGARKISKTVGEKHPSLSVLNHFADESKHAFLFKKMSLALDPACKTYLCAEEAVSYFQGMDQEISRWLLKIFGKENVYASYLWTTTVIERRAMMLYPAYERITKNKVVQQNLLEIIEDEKTHRGPIEDEAIRLLKKQGIDDPLKEALSIENSFFEKFEEALREQIMG